MRVRQPAALAIFFAGLLVAFASAGSHAGGGAGAAHASGPEKTRLSISRPSERRYVARLGTESAQEVTVTISMRLVGRPIAGHRKVIDTVTSEQAAGPGKVRVKAPFPGAAGSCFGYVRCQLKAGGLVESPAPPPIAGGPPGPAETVGSASAVRRVETGRPEIRERPIPYGPKRRSQMAAYSERHYGERDWRLEPRGVVEHYTASDTAGPALATFEENRPDVEYGELPGVCAHFLIDRDGTILELVPTDVRCRHTVGLNHETIGIEHVGQSDADVVGRPRVLRASLALTSWLRCAYGIQRSNVIGHNESLGSPLYKELVPRFQGRTHGDMKRATMRGYRRKLDDC